MQRLTHHGIPAVLVLLSLAGCTDQPSPTDPLAAAPLANASAGVGGKFLVAFSDRRAPADFEARISERGGTVEKILAGPGIAIVSGLTSEGAAELSATGGIDAVAEDMALAPGAPEEETTAPGPWASIAGSSESELTTDAASGKPLPDDASNYGSQWNMRIIHAESAWHAGDFGSPTVRVYLLDTGVDYTRIDLRAHVDPARSISLVPKNDAAGELALAEAEHLAPYMDFHSHGTAVASTIVSNGIDLAGVTTKTKIVAVKVLDRTRVGLFSTFIKGIDYAAKDGADIIHLSLAYPGFSRASPNAAAMIVMADLATTYAHEQGAVIMVAGGNAAANLDNPSFWRFCNAQYVLCVSATAANDQPASYTNYGVNTVTFAGPGGDVVTTSDPRSSMKVLVNCSSFGLVTTGNVAPCGAGGPRFETTGTTYAAAAASGLAALIISRIGHNQPDRVRDLLVSSADDLGPPGRDKFYGAGRINVARALELLGDQKDH